MPRPVPAINGLQLGAKAVQGLLFRKWQFVDRPEDIKLKQSQQRLSGRNEDRRSWDLLDGFHGGNSGQCGNA